MALGFAAHVGHAVLLANGRRSPAPLVAPAQRPAYAGVVTRLLRDQPDDARRADRRRSCRPRPARCRGRRSGSRSSRWLALGALAAARGRSSSGAGRGATCSSSRVAFAFTIIGGYLFLQRRYPIRSIGFIPLGVALALLLYASSLPTEIKPLVPALQNAPLLTIHVGMAIDRLRHLRDELRGRGRLPLQGQNDRFAWLPSHKILDEVAYRAVIIGFPIFATMIILGSWWASIAWSRYWGWDPKETAALVTWLTYAVYLHARNQRSWAGRPAALLLVVGFGMVLVTYSGSLWFSGLHAYSGL